MDRRCAGATRKQQKIDTQIDPDEVLGERGQAQDSGSPRRQALHMPGLSQASKRSRATSCRPRYWASSPAGPAARRSTPRSRVPNPRARAPPGSPAAIPPDAQRAERACAPTQPSLSPERRGATHTRTIAASVLVQRRRCMTDYARAIALRAGTIAAGRMTLDSERRGNTPPQRRRYSIRSRPRPRAAAGPGPYNCALPSGAPNARLQLTESPAVRRVRHRRRLARQHHPRVPRARRSARSSSWTASRSPTPGAPATGPRWIACGAAICRG